MPQVNVFVVQQDGEFVVQPAIAVLVPGDKLKIFNTTQDDIVFRLDVPVGSPYPFTAPAPLGPQSLDEIAKGGVLAREVLPPLPAVRPGIYTYEIFMRQSGKKAKGNSDPMLIIDR